MTKPYKRGKTWSIRSRAKGVDVNLKGYSTAKEAEGAMRKHLDKLDDLGRPQKRGPTLTTMAQGLQDYGLEKLRLLKGAPQEANRINKYLRAAGLETLVLEKVLPEAARDADGGDTPVSLGSNGDSPNSARSTRALGSKACRAPAKTKRTATVYWRVTLEPFELERKVPAKLRDHRLALLTQTADSDRHRLRLACKRVSDVCAADVQNFVYALCDDRLSGATIGLERALLRSFFNHARSTWGWTLGRNPATDLDMPEIDNQTGRVMTEDEQARLDRALLECRNQLVAPTLTLLRETAMRTSEPLQHATWGNVDWDACILKLNDSKTGARNVALSPAALDALRQLGGSPSSPPSEPLVQLTYESLKAAWTRACERADVKDLRLYDLRHTAATRMALKTGNAYLVKALTGHLTYASVERYVKVGATDLVKVMHAKPNDAPAAAPGTQSEQPLTHGVAATSAQQSGSEAATPWPVLSCDEFEESAAGLVWPVLVDPDENGGSPTPWNAPAWNDARSAA